MCAISRIWDQDDVVFKTGQEPALVDLVKQIFALKLFSISLTQRGVGDSNGNGLTERAAQSPASRPGSRVCILSVHGGWNVVRTC